LLAFPTVSREHPVVERAFAGCALAGSNALRPCGLRWGHGLPSSGRRSWPRHAFNAVVPQGGNVLDKLPTALQPKAKRMLHDQYLAPPVKSAQGFDLFVESFSAKYQGGGMPHEGQGGPVRILRLPAAHWLHLRKRTQSNRHSQRFAFAIERPKATEHGKHAGDGLQALQGSGEKWRKLTVSTHPPRRGRKEIREGEQVDEAAT